MLSKNKIRFIRSLEMKKFRSESGCFLAEGNRLVGDILPLFECELLLARPSWLATQGDIRAGELIVAEGDDLERASLLKTPQDVLAVFRQREMYPDTENFRNELVIVLDGIQDPGNLGATVRIADWFGISNVVCSHDSADIYNPKTVQATMGAIARVTVSYADLPELLDKIGDDLPVYGTFLSGENIYRENLTENGLIVMGSEGNGISPAIEQRISHRLYIPSYPADAETVESLNVASATAIICSEFRRRIAARDYI
ncbi:MAG: RNA methyltransferase [Dysgonamonadaceae bacterium]|jgi:TrmH family RNA methyltransferase|nr:RNA methyltransferase [Dysgonamonadaceae bacterium]